MCLPIGYAMPIVVFQSEEISATYNTFNMLWISKRIYTYTYIIFAIRRVE